MMPNPFPSFADGFVLGPSLDLDFVGRLGLDTRINFTRASGAMYYDATGTLQTAATNAPRIGYGPTPGGVTNWIANSTMQGTYGGANQYPNLWSNFAANGLTTTVVNSGTDVGTGFKYVDIRFNGTTTATYYVAVFQNPAVAVSAGATCTQSVYLALVGGSLANLTSFVLDTRYNLAPIAGANIAPSLTSTLTRFSSTTTAPAGTTNVYPGWDLGFTSGAALDVTIRFAAPQFEIGVSSASAFVPTSGTPANVGAVPLGLLIEEQRTNSIRNPRAEGAVVSGTMSPPAAPTLGQTLGGTIAGTTYFVKTTYVDGAGGETLVSPESSFAVTAANLLTVASPASSPNAVSWRVYVSTSTGTETRQATTAIGTNWTEPTSGLVAGAAMPGSATAKTPGTLPTNWLVGGNLVGSGVSQFVIGTGTENGIPYLDLQLVGTTTAASLFNNFFFESNTLVAAASGQSWVGSAYIRLIAGSLTNIAFIGIGVSGRNSSGGNVESFATSSLPLTSARLAAQRSSIAGTFANASTVFAEGYLGLNTGASGLAIDVTLRIGAPQLELGAFATSLILPAVGTPAATTRAADAATMATGPWFNGVSAGTVSVDAMLPQTSGPGFLSLSDGTLANRLTFFASGSSLNWQSTVGGSATNTLSPGSYTAGVPFKLGGTYSSSGLKAAVNGGTVSSGAAGLPPALSTLTIGATLNAAAVLNGYIRRVRYWPRALATNELQQVTT